MPWWPQGPLAVVITLIGFLNFADGLSLPVAALQRIQTLNNLAASLSAIGDTAQVILGALLIVAGTGLWWRLVSAWFVSGFLLLVTVGINALAGHGRANAVLPALILAALLLAKSCFTRRTIIASMVFSISGILGVLAYGLFGSYLLGAGFRPAIRDFGTAFYFTVVSLSTVGYGDIVPVTPPARWFAISLLVMGLGVFASAIASALGPKISGELNRIFNPRDKTMPPKDHVILVGDGVIARNTIEELKRRKLAFVQISAAAAAATAPGHEIIVGDATDDATLREAGIGRARLVIAAHEDDGENAFIVLGAKELNPGVKALAVASSPQAIRRLKLAHADLVFSPAAVGSRLLADLVEGNQIAAEFQDLLEGHPKKA